VSRPIPHYQFKASLASLPQYGEGGDLTKQEIKFPYLGMTEKIRSPKELAFSTNDWSNSLTLGRNYKFKSPPMPDMAHT